MGDRMKIKIRYNHSGGISRIENDARIQEVMINENIINPRKETIALGFVNKDSSGIVEFSTSEFEMIAQEVKKRIYLIKGVKIFGGSGAIRLE